MSPKTNRLLTFNDFHGLLKKGWYHVYCKCSNIAYRALKSYLQHVIISAIIAKCKSIHNLLMCYFDLKTSYCKSLAFVYFPRFIF